MDTRQIIEDKAQKSLEQHHIYCKLHVDTSELDDALAKVRRLCDALGDAARLMSPPKEGDKQ